jgi:succinyl-CoA synthetase alpha subunit
MAILIDETRRVLIQGITGREGRARAALMVGYGTRVVAGVTPGRGGQVVEGVPVFDTVALAAEHCARTTGAPPDASVVFAPAPAVRAAAIEAVEAGVGLLVLVPDRVPVWDTMEIAAAAREHGARFLGPNTLGVISAGRAVAGMIGGRAESARDWFRPGPVGVISRSGGMSSSIAYYLGRAGIGTSTVVHVGGDAVVGVRMSDAAAMFEDDPQTRAIVVFGEIGGSQEEDLAELMASGRVTKPVVAYIGGRAAREGTRFSHAGAIIEGGKGTHEGKVRALREAGASVVESFGDLPEATKAALARKN